MNPDPLEKIGKILAHAARADEAEARAAYELADAMLDDCLGAQRHDQILAAATRTFARDALLTRFRGCLAYAENEGKLNSAGRELLARLRETPPAPKGSHTSPAACGFFAWHRNNEPAIDNLIEKL